MTGPDWTSNTVSEGGISPPGGVSFGGGGARCFLEHRKVGQSKAECAEGNGGSVVSCLGAEQICRAWGGLPHWRFPQGGFSPMGDSPPCEKHGRQTQGLPIHMFCFLQAVGGRGGGSRPEFAALSLSSPHSSRSVFRTVRTEFARQRKRFEKRKQTQR